MSRIADNPVAVPEGVEAAVSGASIRVSGAKGTLETAIHPSVEVAQEDGVLRFRARTKSKSSKALAGTTRSLVNNMVQGVSVGFEKRLQLQGVGYRAAVKGETLTLQLGFSHPVEYQLPKGVSAATPSQTEIVVSGADKQLVGQVSAEIRSFRPPEPYKGKGVRYLGEQVRRKEAKKK
ncbi:MAG: 50S ribosomal protein L6 [Gammaproteobacteria bacterium]|nr:50S ribosomal protein L6 [Gammaproteobacteria bacterium]MXW50399.1 50S ribosomal protein L6 [Gammaproteobacteria bacterium]MXX29230.1 50S ribosomal protein L6 [Gammaproteobacteria bacterium]MXY06222.1 50S ribosomal protein L6 [Gammaproteobacteria bacterium]MYE53312.1 50S ribosomal protein L6 [Gammaproteobacteria bacterium]